jgi:hypothetical protein
MRHVCKGVDCRQDFVPRPNIPNQQYCGKPACQRERRAQWQRRKLAEDPDYREHQRKAKGNWREKHCAYMRNYRRSHPDYQQRDRLQRRDRRRRTAVSVATETHSAVNMDACTSEPVVTPLESGYFRVCRVSSVGSARAVNMDVRPCGSLVQLVVVKEDRMIVPSNGGAP